MKIYTSITINATPQKVWSVFTDFESYPTWNPFVKSLKGKIAEGQNIEVQFPGMKFKPKVLSYRQNEELSWLGHLLFKGLFDGQHSFKLEDNENGTTTFHHFETFGGILVPIFKSKLMKETKQGFEEMNRRLKERVEESVE